MRVSATSGSTSNRHQVDKSEGTACSPSLQDFVHFIWNKQGSDSEIARLTGIFPFSPRYFQYCAYSLQRTTGEMRDPESRPQTVSGQNGRETYVRNSVDNRCGIPKYERRTSRGG